MSGVLSVLAASGGSVVVVGVAAPGGDIFGFSLGGVYGSASPSSIRGVALSQIASIVATVDLRIVLSSVVTQSFFKSVSVQDSSGVYQIKTSASATFTNPGGTSSQWDWSGTGLWTTSHGSRTVEFRF